MSLAEELMWEAIQEARQGNTPFGCVIARDGNILIRAANNVRQTKDPTAHAEMEALRQLSEIPKSERGYLTLYTTGEPCPMCMGGILFSRIGRVVYGASIEQIGQFMPQIYVSCTELAERADMQIEVIGGVLEEACLELFR
ncbi:MAG: nucleoside deaminase [Bacteroidota bacterium]